MKVLLVSQRSDIDPQTGEKRDALDSNWHIFLKECGCIGIPIPNNVDSLNEILSSISFDGILLSGGNTPVSYGGTCPERDAIDDCLIKYSIDYDIPLIGVCRGLQSICLYFGGSLKQVSNHIRTHHKIKGFINESVNSYHSWSPNYPGENIEILCKSEDGQIEMIRHNQLNILGIMWHPEREYPFKRVDLEIFKKHFKVDS